MTDSGSDSPSDGDGGSEGGARRRWRLDVGYDGTDFHGWARQPDRRTVQGVLETWLPTVLRLGEPVTLTCAGRTDAGVHARGQVCHLDLPAEVITDGGTTLLRRLARVLPADVVVTAISPAPDGFDARFAARWRRYSYRLVDDQRPPDPLLRRQVAHWPAPLDLARMNSAAERLLGLRDFAAFCRRREGASTVRTLLMLQGRRLEQDGRSLIDFEVRADAFCHSMVRSLIGALVRVGTGARDVDWIEQLPTAGGRDPGIIVMPPHGLTLEEVGYPADDQLAARVSEARNTRGPLDGSDAGAEAGYDRGR